MIFKPARLILFTVFLLIFLLTIIFERRRIERYWGSQHEINCVDSIDITVSETRYLKGSLSFNKTINVADYDISEASIDLLEISKLEKPIYILKQTHSDTIFVFNSDRSQRHYLILDCNNNQTK